MHETIGNLIAAATTGGNSSAASETIRTLQNRTRIFNHNFVFHDGMLVTWKPGMKQKQVPEYGQPVIVTRTLKDPVLDLENDSGSTYFREPLDLVCGEFIQGDFIEIYFDSRRMMPYDEWQKQQERFLDIDDEKEEKTALT